MRNFNFKYRKTDLDIIKTFNYLGNPFCYTCNFRTACKLKAVQTMKGGVLKINIRNYKKWIKHVKSLLHELGSEM